ncbi:MAG: peptidylprolyl isomerase [Burkholderiales bacterium]|nr:peptidylprolyl isomerase [Burkholderiales bacterium]
MRIAKDTVVALEVALSDLWDNVVERAEGPVRYLHGGYGELLEALEAALEGKAVGDRLTLDLEPADAFGDYDERLLRVEPRERFPAGLATGMRLEGVPGEQAASDRGVIYTVTDIAAGKVVLDGNHPYAGVAVRFRCTVRDVRAATPEEIGRGSADDPGAVRMIVPAPADSPSRTG